VYPFPQRQTFKNALKAASSV